MSREVRVGMVYWERTGSKDTYFGHHIARTLSPAKYRDRTPYYADILGENEIAFHVTTQEEFDEELKMAAEAGVDYFVYTWNSDDKENRIDFVDAPEHLIQGSLREEDNTRRKMHGRSPFGEKVKMCAYLLGMHVQSDRDLKLLIEEMKQDYYEKIDGRPLVYIFSGYRPELIRRLRALAEEAGVASPFVAFANNGPLSDDGDYSLADAVTAYAFGDKGAEPGRGYKEFFEDMNADNEKRKEFGLPIIPLYSLGWSPRPRIDTRVPWVSYRDVEYLPAPTAQEMKDGAVSFREWMQENREFTALNHMIVFAWNEFEEGAWICPTYDGKGGVTRERIGVFAEITGDWRANL